MHAARFVVAIGLCLAATLAQAAGFRFIEVPADTDGPALTGAMWYPCPEPPGEIAVGILTVRGVKDCPISGDKLPLVVVSHGRGGSFVNFHDTAETLADAGFTVAAINHPGDPRVSPSPIATATSRGCSTRWRRGRMVRRSDRVPAAGVAPRHGMTALASIADSRCAEQSVRDGPKRTSAIPAIGDFPNDDPEAVPFLTTGSVVH
jgi:hypothetical protein